jgi:transcription antitermination factor NusG
VPESYLPDLRAPRLPADFYPATWEGTPHWYAIHTRSNFERKVAEELASKQIDPFLPTVREVRAWKDRRKTMEVPIFPGYVFARIIDCEEHRLKILRSPGAVRILGHGADIEPIPDVEIHAIRQLMESQVAFSVLPTLREGAWVRVKRGPLAGVEGTFIRVKNATSLVLSIHLLARSVSTEIGVHDVEVIRTGISRHDNC